MRRNPQEIHCHHTAENDQKCLFNVCVCEMHTGSFWRHSSQWQRCAGRRWSWTRQSSATNTPAGSPTLCYYLVSPKFPVCLLPCCSFWLVLLTPELRDRINEECERIFFNYQSQVWSLTTSLSSCTLLSECCQYLLSMQRVTFMKSISEVASMVCSRASLSAPLATGGWCWWTWGWRRWQQQSVTAQAVRISGRNMMRLCHTCV